MKKRIVVVVGVLSVSAAMLGAERPPCYQLLPAKTLAYVRIADVHELGNSFGDTAIGRMLEEQQLKSLVQQLYEEAEDAFTPVAEQVGLTMAQLFAIPQGEITIAVTAPPNGLPAPVLMMDIQGQQASVKKLLDVLSGKLSQERLVQSSEVIGGTQLSIYQQDDPRFTGIVFFQKQSMLVVTSNLEVARQILAAWDEDPKQPVLEENEDFADVMRHSKGPRGASPQIRWFVDAISLAKVSFRGNLGAQTGLAMLPVIGADGLMALGGSLTFASEEYDSFVQTHVITAEPRTGVLAALAMRSGECTPESWVPADVASYLTVHWDFDATRREAAVLYDSFRGEDMFQEQVLDKANQALDVDVVKDVLESLEGRVSLSTWYIRPARINGVAYLGGIRLKEEASFQKTLAHILERTENNLETKQFGGHTIYFASGDAGEEEDENPLQPMSMQPAFAVLDDYLLIANRPEFIERAVIAHSNSRKSLANELDFKLIYSKARRQPGGRSPGWFAFQRPEEGLRMVYELATAEATLDRLANAAEGNELLGRLNRAVQANPLPPFASLKKYLAPVGSVMTADDKGFHYIGFGLRRGD